MTILRRKIIKEFGWLNGFLKKLERRSDQLGLANLETFFGESEREMERAFTRAFGNKQRFFGLLRLIASPSAISLIRRMLRKIPESLKREMSKDPRHTILLRLISEADGRIEFSPFAALLIVWGGKDFFYEMFLGHLEVINRFVEAQEIQEHEARIKATADALVALQAH